MKLAEAIDFFEEVAVMIDDRVEVVMMGEGVVFKMRLEPEGLWVDVKLMSWESLVPYWEREQEWAEGRKSGSDWIHWQQNIADAVWEGLRRQVGERREALKNAKRGMITATPRLGTATGTGGYVETITIGTGTSTGSTISGGRDYRLSGGTGAAVEREGVIAGGSGGWPVGVREAGFYRSGPPDGTVIETHPDGTKYCSDPNWAWDRVAGRWVDMGEMTRARESGREMPPVGKLSEEQRAELEEQVRKLMEMGSGKKWEWETGSGPGGES